MERCWVWVNEGGGVPPPPPTAPKTIAYPSGSHIGWRRPLWRHGSGEVYGTGVCRIAGAACDRRALWRPRREKTVLVPRDDLGLRAGYSSRRNPPPPGRGSEAQISFCT